MPVYRKKPVEIEARLFKNTTDSSDIVSWILSHGQFAEFTGIIILIRTLEGDMSASIGDYIIKGVAGEFYPCKPDIFAATYELVC